MSQTSENLTQGSWQVLTGNAFQQNEDCKSVMPADSKAAFKYPHYVLQIHVVCTLGTGLCPIVNFLAKGTKSPLRHVLSSLSYIFNMASSLESEAYSNTKCCNFPYLYESLNNVSCQILKSCLTLPSAMNNLNPHKRVPIPIMAKELYVRVTLLMKTATKLGRK